MRKRELYATKRTGVLAFTHFRHLLLICPSPPPLPNHCTDRRGINYSRCHDGGKCIARPRILELAVLCHLGHGHLEMWRTWFVCTTPSARYLLVKLGISLHILPRAQERVDTCSAVFVERLWFSFNRSLLTQAGMSSHGLQAEY